jgi:hypothetical protein
MLAIRMSWVSTREPKHTCDPSSPFILFIYRTPEFEHESGGSIMFTSIEGFTLPSLNRYIQDSGTHRTPPSACIHSSISTLHFPRRRSLVNHIIVLSDASLDEMASTLERKCRVSPSPTVVATTCRLHSPFAVLLGVCSCASTPWSLEAKTPCICILL